MVQLSLRVLFKPNPQELPFIYRRLGKGEKGQGKIESIQLFSEFNQLSTSKMAPSRFK
jgi:hypothetical protein